MKLGDRMDELFISTKYFLAFQKYFTFVKGIINVEVGVINQKPTSHLVYDTEQLTIKDILILISKIVSNKENITIYYRDFKEKAKITNYLLNIKEELKLQLKIKLETLSAFIKTDDSYLQANNLKRDLILEFKNYRSKKPINEYVTKYKNTEAPFINKYWDMTDEGVYVDIETKTPLFKSEDKIQIGYGWPTFKKVINQDDIYTTINYSYGIAQEEVISKNSGNFLGHRVKDIYIINSASLEFVPTTKNAK